MWSRVFKEAFLRPEVQALSRMSRQLAQSVAEFNSTLGIFISPRPSPLDHLLAGIVDRNTFRLLCPAHCQQALVRIPSSEVPGSVPNPSPVRSLAIE